MHAGATVNKGCGVLRSAAGVRRVYGNCLWRRFVFEEGVQALLLWQVSPVLPKVHVVTESSLALFSLCCDETPPATRPRC